MKPYRLNTHIKGELGEFIHIHTYRKGIKIREYIERLVEKDKEEQEHQEEIQQRDWLIGMQEKQKKEEKV